MEELIESIKENEDENKLIFTEADNNWYIIEEFRKMNIIRLIPEDKRSGLEEYRKDYTKSWGLNSFFTEIFTLHILS